MPAKLSKILLLLGIAACLVAIPLFWLTYQAPKNLEVDFLEVGQGDAILIKTPAGQNILIDGGPDKTVLKRLAENLPWWDKQIDLMILTHPHDDHVSGLIDVLKRYHVKRILYTGVTHTGLNYLAWLKLVRDKKVPLVIIDKQQSVELGQGVKLDILYPDRSLLGQNLEDLNQSSLVVKLVYGQSKLLLTSDAGLEVENKLLGEDVDLSADILKVGHHGSEYATSAEFLAKVRPSLAVIAVGEDNQFGHPSLRVIKRLERAGAQVFRTDLNGAVRVVSDGERVERR
jgi:competence protein ComEC